MGRSLSIFILCLLFAMLSLVGCGPSVSKQEIDYCTEVCKEHKGIWRMEPYIFPYKSADCLCYDGKYGELKK